MIVINDDSNFVGTATTASAPCLVTYTAPGSTPRLYCLYRAADNSIRLLRKGGSAVTTPVACSNEFITNGQGLNVCSKFAPAVAAKGSTLFFVYGGENGNDIYAASWNSSAYTNLGQILSAESDAAPSLMTFGPSLFTVYKGNGSNQLYYSYSAGNDNGTKWNGDRTLKSFKGRTIAAPAIASAGDVAVVAYLGTNGPPSAIYLGYSTNGESWGGDTYIKYQILGVPFTPPTSLPVSVAAYGGNAYLAYVDPRDGRIHVLKSTVPTGIPGKLVNPASWSWGAETEAWQDVPLGTTLSTDQAPAGVEYGGVIQIMYKQAGQAGCYRAALAAIPG